MCERWDVETATEEKAKLNALNIPRASTPKYEYIPMTRADINEGAQGKALDVLSAIAQTRAGSAGGFLVPSDVELVRTVIEWPDEESSARTRIYKRTRVLKFGCKHPGCLYRGPSKAVVRSHRHRKHRVSKKTESD
jgi:hypothetical protein